GLERATDPGGLLHHLFSVRTEGLFGRIPSGNLASYLSGVLIGHEINGLAPTADHNGKVIVSAASPLAEIYGTALSQFGYHAEIVAAEEALIAGLLAIARQQGWLPR